MINFKYIVKICGKLLYIECFFIAITALVALYYGENDFWAFITTAAMILGVATAMVKLPQPSDRTLTRKDGYFIVTSIWILFTLFGSLPYIISGHIPNFADAFFETMSGFTTTGSTILTDIEAMPHATLFWRSLTQWLGGMGIITLFIALLPSLGIEGRDLYIAEDTSPLHSKTGATFAFTTRTFWLLYLSFTAVCTIMLRCGGMDWFNALNHAFTSVATGGFSTKNLSVGFWGNAPFIQYTLIFFMFIGGVNFALIYTLFNRHWKKFFQDAEIKFCIGIILTTSLIVGICLYINNYNTLEGSLRTALFHIVSIMSTSGFVTENYELWPGLTLPFLVFVMFMGECSGSTSGGLKCIRGLMVFKTIFSEMKRIIHPNAIILVKYNKRGVRPEVSNSIMNFFILYMLIIILGALLLYPMLENSDWATAISASLTSISNVGPAFAGVGPTTTFAWMSGSAKIFCAALMLIGRLEMFTVLVLFTREFWRR